MDNLLVNIKKEAPRGSLEASLIVDNYVDKLWIIWGDVFVLTNKNGRFGRWLLVFFFLELVFDFWKKLSPTCQQVINKLSTSYPQ